ncbi:MAG: insulinase family protein [Treponemataceae bacterium]|nr:insulinase family protein [Treponemataceae bacterium]
MSLITFGCATTSSAANSANLTTNSAGAKSDIRMENFVLDNGIQVMLKNSDEAKVNTLELYFSFGASELENDQLGYLGFLMNLLVLESKDYDKDFIEALLEEKQASITTGVLSDFSYISMTSLEKYFDEVFKVFESCCTNPSYKSFEQKKTQAQFSFLNTKSVDYNLLMKSSAEYLRETTDYFGKNIFTEETILKLSRESLEKLYSQLFSSGKVAIIGYGNFDDSLKLKLNDSFGKIKLNKAKPEKQIKLKFENEKIEFKKNHKNPVDFACSYKALPDVKSVDFAACYIANLMYSDILYNIVREKYGCVYSIFSNVNLTKNPVLILSGYRISNKELFYKGVDEANEIFAKGKLIKESENFTLIDSTEKLESYKNILINRLYGDIFTSRQICAMMANSYSLGDDINFLYDFENTVKSVTKEDLLKAIKFISEADETWFYLTSK